MPNWCTNSFSVSHKDPEMVAKFAQAVRDGNLFETFVPLSSGEWDYGTACEEWGTKWDISGGDVDVDENNESCNGWFDTAWSPAIEAYRKLSELGFDLDILYNEPGMCFAGRYTSEGDDYYVEYDFGNENWRDNIDDSEILELLENDYENWVQWQEEEKVDDGA